ncbi:MAG TPA: DinB family protein [bacterium]|jgi:hypothetical protein
MNSLFDDTVRAQIRERLEKLTPQHKAQWGKFVPATMLTHLIDTFEVAFAERPVTVKKGFLNSALGRWMVIDSPMPWPKGSPTAPEYLESKPGEFVRDKQRVLAYVDRFAKGRGQQWGRSPGFGDLTPEQWSRLNFRHLNHHLIQFGL